MISPVLPTYNRAPLAFARGEGSYLFTTDGQRFLDFGAGIAVNALGHAHPAMVAALREQAGRLWHVSNLYQIPEQERLARLLVAHTFADTVFFGNSGTEATELALKMARRHHFANGQPGRTGFVTLQGAFHGRSTGAIAAAGSEKMVKGFGPLMPGFTTLPWGDDAALDHAITDETCAVIVEPIQGEGGIRPLGSRRLRRIRELCDATGTLLILDEIQCGMGRTARLFAHEHAGITPDIMLVAKGLGAGFPIGATLATEAAAAGMTAGSHGSTFGGNPLACAVGATALSIIAEPAFLAEVARKGVLLHEGLERLAGRHPVLFDHVRGEGLMLGLKCRMAPGPLIDAARDEGLLLVAAADDTVRVLPALNIPDEEIAEGLARLDKAATTLAG